MTHTVCLCMSVINGRNEQWGQDSVLLLKFSKFWSFQVSEKRTVKCCWMWMWIPHLICSFITSSFKTPRWQEFKSTMLYNETNLEPYRHAISNFYLYSVLLIITTTRLSTWTNRVFKDTLWLDDNLYCNPLRYKVGFDLIHVTSGLTPILKSGK